MIKKAYRKLSLTFHPDKMKTKSEEALKKANQKFIEIAEAYRTLTDDEAFENWQNYGHPDGERWRRAMHSAPLPTFLMVANAKSSTSSIALIGYALLIICTPLCCICAATKEKKSNDLTDLDRAHYLDKFNRLQNGALDIVRIISWCATGKVFKSEREKERERASRIMEKHCSLTFLFLFPLIKPVSLSLSRIFSYSKNTQNKSFF